MPHLWKRQNSRCFDSYWSDLLSLEDHCTYSVCLCVWSCSWRYLKICFTTWNCPSPFPHASRWLGFTSLHQGWRAFPFRQYTILWLAKNDQLIIIVYTFTTGAAKKSWLCLLMLLLVRTYIHQPGFSRKLFRTNPRYLIKTNGVL